MTDYNIARECEIDDLQKENAKLRRQITWLRFGIVVITVSALAGLWSVLAGAGIIG